MGLLDYADAAREGLLGYLRGRKEVAKGLLGAAYDLATDPKKRAATVASMPKPFQPVGEQDMETAMSFWNPGGLLGTFAGVNAKTANKAMLEVAQKMDKAGADRGAIWKETGWFKGPDSKWRFEIDDSKAQLESGGKYFGPKGGGGTAEQVMPHPDLYGAYPDMAKMPVSYTFSGNALEGSYSPAADFVYIKDPMGIGSAKSPTLHEFQHAIQQREGFARGGSPDAYKQQAEAQLARDALSWRNEIIKKRESMKGADLIAVENALVNDYQKIGAMDWLPSREARDLGRQPNVMFPDKYPNVEGGFKDLQELVKVYGLDKNVSPRRGDEIYRSLAGEAEARATQARMNMTPAERKAKAPWESYDIPWDQLIVRY